jgi:hypothetical protein
VHAHEVHKIVLWFWEKGEVHTYELNKLSSCSIIRITHALVGSFTIWDFGLLDFLDFGSNEPIVHCNLPQDRSRVSSVRISVYLGRLVGPATLGAI